MDSLRPLHRDYIKSHLDIISFGGLVVDEKANPTTVCICLGVETAVKAREFIQNDPYAPLYRDIQISAFRQMIPGLIV